MKDTSIYASFSKSLDEFFMNHHVHLLYALMFVTILKWVYEILHLPL